MDVASVKNDSVVTLVPIHDILKGKPPGAYVLIAMDGNQDETKDYYEDGTIATQWVVDSDIALTTFQSTSGLSVFARSYASARPMGGVKLTLVAKDNNVLSTVTTDGAAAPISMPACCAPRAATRRSWSWPMARAAISASSTCAARPST
jgi:uncharacterized protein YfaS (alpha-2-macroglobulin family)